MVAGGSESGIVRGGMRGAAGGGRPGVRTDDLRGSPAIPFPLLRSASGVGKGGCVERGTTVREESAIRTSALGEVPRPHFPPPLCSTAAVLQRPHKRR